jgi:hypothetical protein
MMSGLQVKLPEGPMPQFSHAIEPHLREKLGMPTKLVRGAYFVRSRGMLRAHTGSLQVS